MLKTLTIREIRELYEALVTAKELKFDEKMRYRRFEWVKLML